MHEVIFVIFPVDSSPTMMISQMSTIVSSINEMKWNLTFTWPITAAARMQGKVQCDSVVTLNI